MTDSSSSLHLHAHIKRVADNVSTDLDHEVAIMNIPSGRYFYLNPTSARIWNLAASPIEIDALCHKLVAEFGGVTLDDCREQVLAHLHRMQDDGLITVVTDHVST